MGKRGRAKLGQKGAARNPAPEFISAEPGPRVSLYQQKCATLIGATLSVVPPGAIARARIRFAHLPDQTPCVMPACLLVERDERKLAKLMLLPDGAERNEPRAWGTMPLGTGRVLPPSPVTQDHVGDILRRVGLASV